MRLACADQVNRALRKSSLLGIPASTLLALILGSSVPTSRRVAFVLFVSLTYAILNFVVDLCYVWLDPRVRL